MKSLVFALYQLTRLPLPQLPFDARTCGKATAYFPLAGLILGGITAVVAWLAGYLFPVQVQAAIIVVAIVVITGGIHLDGFMDTVDGLFCGKVRKGKLEVMRDSRVGAFGVVSVVCLLLLKYSLLIAIPENIMFYALPVIMTLSRLCMTFAIVIFKYAREQGLGAVFKAHSTSRELIMAFLSATFVAMLFLEPIKGLLLIVTGLIATWLIGTIISKDLGGLTGDTYGFINEIIELLLLFTLFLVL